MKELIAKFGMQLDEALAISKKNPLKFKKRKFNQVYVSGLGGSGIWATMVQDFVKNKLTIPFTVNKSYDTHKSIDENTLFIACSYSGNTEETLACLKTAMKVQAEIVCITSGGYVADIASKNNLKCILVPGGMPPRSCLGYSLTQLIHTLHQAGQLKTEVASQFKGVTRLLESENKAIHMKATSIA